MGWKYPPWYGQSKEFYEKEKIKTLAKIEKLQEKVKACDEAIAELGKDKK